MKNFRKLGKALALSMFIAAGIVSLGPTLHAQPSDRSVQVRCALLQRAIETLTALYGADSQLVIDLQNQYASLCQ
jgi:hypothetical protein